MNALADNYCDKVAALPCAPPDGKQTCASGVSQEIADAEHAGCTAQLQQVLTCADGVTFTCDKSGQITPNLLTGCKAQVNALDHCESGLAGGSDCSSGTAGGGGTGNNDVNCSVTCPDVGASCNGPSATAPVACTCQGGAHDGLAFQATSCGNLETITKQTCR